MEIVCTKTEKAAVRKAAGALTRLFEIAGGGRPVLFLSSGGSALQLVEHLPTRVLGSHMTVSVVDERFNADERVQNLAQLAATSFFKKAEGMGVACIDTRPQTGEVIEALADRLDRALKSWRREHESGVVIATLGMGADGHTAGVVPLPEDPATFKQKFLNIGRWAVAYDAGGKNRYPHRVTTTLAFLEHMVDRAVVLVTGSKKRAALTRLLNGNGTLAETPARVFLQMRDVSLFTDVAV